MASESDEEVVGWTLGFAEDVDLPGWVYLPKDLDGAEQDLFIAEVTRLLQELMGETAPERPPPSDEQLKPLIRAGLAARAESDSARMYQVWPVSGPVALLLNVNAVRTADLPDWTQMPGVLHPAAARHIGPGLQYSTRRVVEDEDDNPLEVSAVHFIFANEEQGVMLSLEESASALISQALVGFGLFKNALTLTWADGSILTSKAPAGVVADEEWSVDEDKMS